VAVGWNKPTRPVAVQTVEGVRNAEDGKAMEVELHRVERRRLMSRRGKRNPKEGALRRKAGAVTNGRTL
jgi:hypothetical protein